MKKRGKSYACLRREEEAILESTELACQTMSAKCWTLGRLAKELRMSRRRLKRILKGTKEMTLREFARLGFKSESELIETGDNRVPGAD